MTGKFFNLELFLSPGAVQQAVMPGSTSIFNGVEPFIGVFLITCYLTAARRPD